MRINPWHTFFTLLFFALLYSFANAPEELAVLLVVAYLLARLTFFPIKRFFFRKAVAFDMGGVVTKGDFYTEELVEMEGTRDLVERLKVGHKVALLTNNNALAFGAFDRKFGLSQLFDVVIVSGKEGAKKPDEALFKIALRKLHVRSHDLYFLDDAPANVEAAKKLGIHGIVFKDATQAEAELKKAGLRF
ncbi:HAD-IA family hydrolase [Candidatus Micrarchaeota archaeon]|nr:HAD-IA family hydrolase [Candidatus Micrarchaeota archaeon]